MTPEDTRDAMLQQLYFEHVNNGIVIYTPTADGTDFEIVDMNVAGMKMGHIHDLADIRGRTVSEVFPGVIALGLLKRLRQVYKNGVSFESPPTPYETPAFTTWLRHAGFRLPTGEIVVIFEDLSDQIQHLERDRQALDHENRLLIRLLEDIHTINDVVTGEHVQRISRYARCLASAHGCAPSVIQAVARFGSLHDIGKVGLPTGLLTMTGTYTPEQREAMQQHVFIGGNILRRNGFPDEACAIAEFHHERWDGTGYLLGLTGEAIPMEARIVAIVDFYDALLTRRPYKDAFPREEAESVVLAGFGTHFDPAFRKAFQASAGVLYGIYRTSMLSSGSDMDTPSL